MHIKNASPSAWSDVGDLLVVGVYASCVKKTPLISHIDKKLAGELTQAIRDADFRGHANQQVILSSHGKLKARRVALLGLGPQQIRRPALQAAAWLRFGGSAVRLGNAHGAKHLVVALPQGGAADAEQLARQVARGIHLGDYAYSKYRTAPRRRHTVKQASLVDGKEAVKVAAAILQDAAVVAQSVALVRDLVNQPANDLYPENFAALCASLAGECAVHCRIIEPPALAKAGMRLLLAVGAGSERSPRLVHLRYVPDAPHGKKSAPPVVLVGKGITFDSGGLSLKAPDAMYGMKMDMGGAATVLASVLAAARLRLPVAVHGVLALAENMPSGHATRPGDVFTSAAGKTVEINNTDAEGRLVLADALHFAGQLQPRCLIDYATLTGACMIALGTTTAGLFSNSDGLAGALLQASYRAGEDFWRLPLTPVLREQLRSDVADLRNTGERYGGAITAALFLQEFVDHHPWAHLDIAGPATCKEEAGAHSKGGTGVAVAATVDFLRQLAASSDEFTVD